MKWWQVLVIGILGSVAGALIASLVLVTQLPLDAITLPRVPQFLFAPKPEVHERLAQEAQQSLAPTLAFVVPTSDTVALEQALGVAAAVTNDGWFVTAFVPPKQARLVLADGTLAEVVQVVTDKGTGLSFLRTPLRPGVVLQVRQAPVARGLDTVLVGKEYLEFTNIASIIAQPAATEEPAWKMPRRFMVSGNRTALPGTLLGDANGDVVGIVAADDLIIPGSMLTDALRHVLPFEASRRPVLAGVTVTALEAFLVPPQGLPGHGAWLRSVSPSSAAYKAGLRAGDVIIAVHQEKISLERSLAEILSEYTSGSIIELRVLRGNQEKLINLVINY